MSCFGICSCDEERFGPTKHAAKHAKKFRHRDSKLRIRLRRRLHLQFHLDLNPDLNLNLNPSLLRELPAKFYPQLLAKFLEPLPGLILANKLRRLNHLRHRELYGLMLPSRQPPGHPPHGKGDFPKPRTLGALAPQGRVEPARTAPCEDAEQRSLGSSHVHLSPRWGNRRKVSKSGLQRTYR